MLRIIIAVVLLAHGIGHVMGILQVTRVATVNPSWQGVGAAVVDAAVLGAVLWLNWTPSELTA